MTTPIETQDSNVLPPERLKVFPIEVTTTAQCYDLAPLLTTAEGVDQRTVRTLFVTLAPIGSSVFHHFRPDFGTDLSDTAKIAAGAALVPAAGYSVPIPDGARAEARISFPKHRYLVLKTASGSQPTILYLWASSNEAGPA